MTTQPRPGLLPATSVRLPPIGVPVAQQSGWRASPSKVSRSSHTSQQLIYRSIPPNQADFIFSDMLGSGIPPRPGGKKGKNGQFPGNTTASEFAKRFKARPTTQPKVIEFNARAVNHENKRRGVNGFFPPVKLRGSAKIAQSNGSEAVQRQSDVWFMVQGLTWKTGVSKMVPIPRNDSRCSEIVSVTNGHKSITNNAPKQCNSFGDINCRQTLYEQYSKDTDRPASQMSSSYNSATGEEDYHSGSVHTDADLPKYYYRASGGTLLTPSRFLEHQEVTYVPHVDVDSTVTMTPASRVSTRMQLLPTSYSEVRPRSSRSVSSRKSNNSIRRTPDSVRTAPPVTDNYSIYPNVFQETFDCDDLSLLPPPKRILPRRELPWVFRYKVKKNMNELSKIMASKPQQLIDV